MQKNAKTATALVISILAIVAIMPLTIQPTTATTEGSFSIVWITDTQYLAESNPALNDNLSRWIVDSAAAYNVQMVIHTGDIVEDEGNLTQWQNANQSMGIILDSGIPYTWNAGNHDFNSSYYVGNHYTAFNPAVLSSKPYWVSTEYDGMNNAVFFNASGFECLIVSIAYDANDTVLAWANGILDQYPNAHAIVTAHEYLDKQCKYDDWATELKEKVLDTHANVFLTLSGHFYPTPGNRTRVGGRDELLFNQQDAYSKQGAASARILTFNPMEGTIRVQTYSVLLNGFVDDANNNFTLTTSFHNDSAGRSSFPLVWVVVAVLVSVAVVGCVFLVRRRRVG
jgi:DNA repair exonuclease